MGVGVGVGDSKYWSVIEGRTELLGATGGPFIPQERRVRNTNSAKKLKFKSDTRINHVDS